MNKREFKQLNKMIDNLISEYCSAEDKTPREKEELVSSYEKSRAELEEYYKSNNTTKTDTLITIASWILTVAFVCGFMLLVAAIFI